MRIALFIPSFPTLSETFILNQITGLLDRGHEITIFARGPGRGEMLHDDVKSYNLLDRTYYFGSKYQKKPNNIILRYTKAFLVLLNSFHYSPGPLINTLNIKKYGKKALRLSLFYQVKKMQHAEVQKYDIIHAHFGEMGEYAAFLKKIGLIRGKIITTFYGWDISKYIKLYGKEVYKDLFQLGDKFLCLSEEMKDRVIAIGCPADKVLVHHLGVDVNRFNIPVNRVSKNGKIRLLTVGRFVEKKGIEYAVQAVSEVAKKYPHIEYVIIGEGPLFETIKNKINELKVDNIVNMLGSRTQSDVIKELSQADIFIAPSVTAESGDQEGTPTVLIEAHALGLPVLSTYHSGIPEVVLDNKTGYLVPERNSKALAARLQNLVENAEKRISMGEEGRKHIDTHFNIEVLNDQLVKLYQSL